MKIAFIALLSLGIVSQISETVATQKKNINYEVDLPIHMKEKEKLINDKFATTKDRSNEIMDIAVKVCRNEIPDWKCLHSNSIIRCLESMLSVAATPDTYFNILALLCNFYNPALPTIAEKNTYKTIQYLNKQLTLLETHSSQDFGTTDEYKDRLKIGCWQNLGSLYASKHVKFSKENIEKSEKWYKTIINSPQSLLGERCQARLDLIKFQSRNHQWFPEIKVNEELTLLLNIPDLKDNIRHQVQIYKLYLGKMPGTLESLQTNHQSVLTLEKATDLDREDRFVVNMLNFSYMIEMTFFDKQAFSVEIPNLFKQLLEERKKINNDNLCSNFIGTSAQFEIEGGELPWEPELVFQSLLDNPQLSKPIKALFTGYQIVLALKGRIPGKAVKEPLYTIQDCLNNQSIMGAQRYTLALTLINGLMESQKISRRAKEIGFKVLLQSIGLFPENKELKVKALVYHKDYAFDLSEDQITNYLKDLESSTDQKAIDIFQYYKELRESKEKLVKLQELPNNLLNSVTEPPISFVTVPPISFAAETPISFEMPQNIVTNIQRIENDNDGNSKIDGSHLTDQPSIVQHTNEIPTKANDNDSEIINNIPETKTIPTDPRKKKVIEFVEGLIDDLRAGRKVNGSDIMKAIDLIGAKGIITGHLEHNANNQTNGNRKKPGKSNAIASQLKQALDNYKLEQAQLEQVLLNYMGAGSEDGGANSNSNKPNTNKKKPTKKKPNVNKKKKR